MGSIAPTAAIFGGKQSAYRERPSRVPDTALRVAVFEDDPMVVESVAEALRKEGHSICGHADRAECAASLVVRERPHVVLMDIELAGTSDGIAAAEQIRAENYAGSLIYLTAHASRATVARARKTRPHGYLLKPFLPKQLLTALEISVARAKEEALLREELDRARSALAQVQRLADDALGRCPAARSKAHREQRANAQLWEKLDQLSAREREVFEHAVRGESLEQVSRALFISPHTTRNHLASIYRKLGVCSRLELSTTYLPLVGPES